MLSSSSNNVSFGKNIKVELLPLAKPRQELVQDKVAHLELSPEDRDNAFFLGDLGDVVKKYQQWKEMLPRVEPFYAMKCNDDPAVVKMLAALGAGFDCASMAEIKAVLKHGVAPERIIYANPCKQSNFISFAQRKNVSMMTFDNEAELYKIKHLFPKAQLVLRILPPAHFKVQCMLGNKFGCLPTDAHSLLDKARQLELDVIGVSFHVGSGVQEAAAYAAAVETAAEVFSVGQDLGYNFTLLDIGGGFPGHAHAPIAFTDIASVLTQSLNKHFPAKRGVRIIAEPGRYFVASAFTLTVSVISKRCMRPTADEVDLEKGAFMYYVNDGVYGSFNCLLYDHAEVHAELVNAPVNSMEFITSVWGPTCDGLDQILKGARLPELEVGDRLHFADMGAYSMAAGSTFNGMPRPLVYYYCDEHVWNAVFPLGVSSGKTASPLGGKRGIRLPVLKTGHALDVELSAPTSPLPLTPVLCSLSVDDGELGH